MGFFKDRASDFKAAVADGDPERAADLIVHSMLEGSGTLGENLDSLTEAVQADES
ncbi:hypothetical protein [Streptomyces sp. BBFR109]|uniref:hypothetical protein n=1 Tax=Streptomyces sp. BBFR109 TaxID=3448172 RepID=UPI003F763DFF